jgi:hypothetical protein
MNIRKYFAICSSRGLSLKTEADEYLWRVKILNVKEEQHPFSLANTPDAAWALHWEETVVRQLPQQVGLAPRWSVVSSVCRLLAAVSFDWLVVNSSARGLPRVVS